MGKRREQRYEDILDAASTLFLEKGYERTSIQDIAEAIGVLKGSLYYYIEAKEDLLYSVIQVNHENLVDSMEQALSAVRDRPEIERVETFLRNHMCFVLTNVERSASFQFEFRSLSQERQAEIIECRRAYGIRFADLLSEAQREGEVAGDVDPRVASRALLSMLNSVLRWYRPGGELNEGKIVSQYTMLALRAVTAAGVQPSVDATDRKTVSVLEVGT